MAQPETEWENMGQLAGPENILIVALNQPQNQAFAGKRLAEIAKLQNKDWRDAAMDLVLTEHRRVETIYFLMSEDNLALQLKLPWIKIGTDSVGMNPEGAKDLAHPRVVRDVSEDTRRVRAREEDHAAGRGGAQDDVGDGAAAFDRGSRAAAGGDVRRRGDLRCGDGRGSELPTRSLISCPRGFGA